LAEKYLKRILSITFLNFFISGGLTLIIPLLLLERNVDLTEIGLILSVFPLVYMIVRLFMAAIADLLGWARFYLVLFWPGSLISTLIFFIATSTPFFLLGKIIEGVKESAYWAVNRTAIFSLATKQKGKESTKNIAVLWLSIAIGSVVSGIGGFRRGNFGKLKVIVQHQELQDPFLHLIQVVEERSSGLYLSLWLFSDLLNIHL
jgi:MFS family permease